MLNKKRLNERFSSASQAIKASQRSVMTSEEKTKQIRDRAQILANHYAEEYSNHVLERFIACSLMTLHDKEGFGEKRLKRFIEGVFYQVEFIAGKEVNPEDMFDVVKNETKFDWWKFKEEKVKTFKI